MMPHAGTDQSRADQSRAEQQGTGIGQSGCVVSQLCSSAASEQTTASGISLVALPLVLRYVSCTYESVTLGCEPWIPTLYLPEYEGLLEL